jgi:hypothetical protein
MRMARGACGEILALLLPHRKGAVMRQFTEKVEDIAQYVIGAPVFVAVAALTALVMLVGFPVVEAYERLRHHS